MAESNPELIRYLQQIMATQKIMFCAYMEQHEHTEEWGYPRLAKCFKKLAKVKAEFAHILNHQLEFFDQGVGRFEEEYEELEWPRHDVQGIIEADLKFETQIRALAGKAKKRGVELEDPVTANKFTKVARRSEDAIRKLQAALSVIDETSVKMYRQNANLD